MQKVRCTNVEIVVFHNGLLQQEVRQGCKGSDVWDFEEGEAATVPGSAGGVLGCDDLSEINEGQKRLAKSC